MTTLKLSPAQRKALEIAVQNGDKGISKFDTTSAVITALHMKNMIAARRLPTGGYRYTITEHGKAALSR